MNEFTYAPSGLIQLNSAGSELKNLKINTAYGMRSFGVFAQHCTVSNVVVGSGWLNSESYVGTNHCKIDNCRFDGVQARPLVFTNNAADCIVTNTKFINATGNLDICYTTRLQIRNCLFEGMVGISDFMTGSVDQLIVEDCVFKGAASGWGYGHTAFIALYFMSSGSKHKICNNYFYGTSATTAIRLDSYVGGDFFCDISNNYFINANILADGIRCNNFIGNYFHGVASGIYYGGGYSGYNCEYNNISKNYFYNSKLQLYNAEHNTVEGNLFFGSSSDLIYTLTNYLSNNRKGQTLLV